MKQSPAIWLLFTVLFFCFGAYHLVLLASSVPRFEWSSSRETVGDFYSPSANETRKNVVGFIAQWNRYIDNQNRNSRWLNAIAAVTYFISAYIAFRSSGLDSIKETTNYCRYHYAKIKKCVIEKWKTTNHIDNSKDVKSGKGQNQDQ